MVADFVEARIPLLYLRGVSNDNKNYKWICRLRVEKANKYIILPDGTPSGKSYPIKNLNDIFAFGDEIIESAKRFTHEEQ